MTNKEKTIKELKEVLDGLDITSKYRLNLIRAIEYLQKEPVIEDLEESSKKYALNNTPWDDCADEMQEAYKAGANWQKEKGISYEDVVDSDNKDNVLFLENIGSMISLEDYFDFGDRVIVQI